MRHPKETGDRSTLAIMLAFQTAAYPIFVPFGENTRYDLVIDVAGTLRRVQCKTGRLRNGAVCFATCSTYGHHSNPKVLKRPYLGEIDDFAVFCPELGAVYLIPIEDVSTRAQGNLRVDPPRNRQFKNVRFATPYEIARIEVS